MALLCGSASVTFPSSSFPTHKNAITTTKPFFVASQLPLPKLSLSSSSIGTHFPASFRVRCQQESTSVADDPRFMCVEPEPQFKGPDIWNKTWYPKAEDHVDIEKHGILLMLQIKFLED